jgi:hypothetical protein
MSRWLAPFAVVAVLGVAAPTAGATPRLCTPADSGGYGTPASAPNPRGVTITHLYAKIDGLWQEPQNVCVAVRFEISDPNNRYVQYGLWNSGGFYLNLGDEPHLPAGTPISLGLQFPPGAKPVMTSGQYRDGIVAFGDDTIDIQAKTAPWTYVDSAYNPDKTAGSGATDCSKGFTVFRSTFGGFIRVQSLNADGTPSHQFDFFQGTFMEGNGTGAADVGAEFDDKQRVKAVTVHMEGCGDNDVSTLEGHFSAFLAPPMLTFLGFPGNALESAASLFGGLMQIRDLNGTTGVKEQFAVVKDDDLQFDPIDGVTFTPLPSGPGPHGLFVAADFSYSKHTLVVERRKANVSRFTRCRATGGTPRRHGKTIVCRRARRR